MEESGVQECKKQVYRCGKNSRCSGSHKGRQCNLNQVAGPSQTDPNSLPSSINFPNTMDNKNSSFSLLEVCASRGGEERGRGEEGREAT